MDVRQDILNKLFRFLKSDLDANVLIPLVEHLKKPVQGASFAGGRWTWRNYKDKLLELQRLNQRCDIGILAKTLFVLDADSLYAITYLLRKYPILEDCPQEDTTKGRHYFLLRTALCDQLGLFDKADCFKDVETHELLKIDLKTISKSQPFKDGGQTPGLIVVDPSHGKRWIKPLWENPLIKIPDEMAIDLAAMYQARSAHSQSTAPQVTKRGRGRPAKTPVLGPSVEVQERIDVIDRKRVDAVLPTLMQKGFLNIRVVSLTEQGFIFIAADLQGQRCKCPLCPRIHTSQCWFCILSSRKGYEILTVRSYSPRCILTQISHNKAFSDFFHIDETLYDRIDFLHHDWTEVPTLSLPNQGGVQMIVSGCGSKKSLRMRESMETAAVILGMPVEDVRVVLLTTRRAFADSKTDEMNREGYEFLHYKVAKAESIDLRTSTKSTVEIESSFNLHGGRAPHILFLDEGETVSATLSSETMKAQIATIMHVIEHLMKKSKWVLWLDATPTTRGMVWMNEILHQVERKAICHWNDKTLLKRKAHRLPSKMDGVNALLDKLRRGKKVAIILGTKSHADKLYALLLEIFGESLKILYYRRGMPVEDRATLRNVNVSWKVDVVMYTGTILNGIDCWIRRHFHCAFVFGFAGHGPNARDLFQMTHRVRDFIDEEIFFFMQQVYQSGESYMTSLQAIRHNSPAILELQNNVMLGGAAWEECPKWLSETHLHNHWETNLSRVHLDKSFTYWCETAGYTVIDHEKSGSDGEVTLKDLMAVKIHDVVPRYVAPQRCYLAFGLSC